MLLLYFQNVEDANNSAKVKQIINDCIESVSYHYPWYFMEHQEEMKHAYGDIGERSFDLKSARDVAIEITGTSELWKKFSKKQNPNSTKAVVKKLLDWMSNTVSCDREWCYSNGIKYILSNLFCCCSIRQNTKKQSKVIW